MRLPPRNQRSVLKIGELAELLETTPRTIRLYEELGLISPERTEGGTRLYASKDVKRMGVALRLSRVGIDLNSVHQIASTRQECATGQSASAAVLPLLSALRTHVAHLRDDLDFLERDLQSAAELIQQCRDCPNRPNRRDCPECPVNKNLASTDLGRLVWDPDSP